MGYNIDKDGYILDGRFAGKHIDTVLAYTESLEGQITGEGKPPAKKPATPAEELEAANRGRVDATTVLTNQRLEDDDRAAFIAKVGAAEYEKYKEQIAATMRGLQPAQRVVRNVHWTIYVQLKSQEADFADRVMGKTPPAAPPPAKTEEEGEEEETAEEKEARELEEKAAEARRKADEAKAAKGGAPPPKSETPPKPAAAPPKGLTAPQTPGRAGGSKERRPKLVANDKVKRAAREWGMSVDKYLMQLEDRGFTQDDLERGSAPREESRRKSVFDRPTAG